jgi:O-acetyl-ADP-ribose deacetylase (regulator of RNase III)
MTLEARLADITKLDVDAIVNAANQELTRGGGVCGAIFEAAGASELAAACAPLRPCPPGQARITPGFKLLARHVIHAVGPRWQGGHTSEADLLASAYRASLDLATVNNLRSIAFPGISTGVYGYPLAAATAIAVATVRAYLEKPGSIEHVIFACFTPDSLEAYRARGITA